MLAPVQRGEPQGFGGLGTVDDCPANEDSTASAVPPGMGQDAVDFNLT